MFPALQEYHRPRTLGEALELLARPGVRTAILAGGTELNGRTDLELQAVVDLAALELDGLESAGGELRLGAMVRLQQLAESRPCREYLDGILIRAARSSAPLTIRQAATLGGTLAGEKGGDELPTVLAALDARVTLTAAESIRQMPMADFLANRAAALAGAIITEVSLPAPPPGARAALVKVARTPADRAMVCAAAVLAVDGSGVCRHARLALGGAGPWPGRAPAAEALLTGHPLVAERVAAAAMAVAERLEPVGDFRASAEYRRWVAPVLARRALHAAWRGEAGADAVEGV